MPKGNWIAPERNYDGIFAEKLRRAIDTQFNQAADELSDAYYNFWRAGNSHPWRGYDVQPTPAESKALFDKLHGLIWHLYTIAFHQANLNQPVDEQIDEARYNFVEEGGKTSLSDLAAQRVAELEAEGITLTIP